MSKSQAGNQTHVQANGQTHVQANGQTKGQTKGQTDVFALRVYWEDTDAAGIVYYANYLKYAERARSEILYAAGIDQTKLRETDGVVFGVRTCNAEYLLPARLGDQLEVHTRVAAVKGASFELRQTVMRGPDALVVMDVRLSCIDHISGKPARLPARVKAVLSGTEE